MGSLLQQLENNEAILQMYLADELGVEDRREVEQMLRGDAGLAAELDELRAAQNAVMAAIGALDQSAPLAISTPAAVRQVSRLMKQWQVDRLARPAVEAQKGGRFPWWTYPAASVATAAGVLIAMMVWWGMKSDGPIAGTVSPATAPTIVATDDQGSQQNQQNPEGQGDFQISEDNSGLADAEQQASALARRSDNVAATASIFMTEPVQ
jgi:hypothetical protein